MEGGLNEHQVLIKSSLLLRHQNLCNEPLQLSPLSATSPQHQGEYNCPFLAGFENGKTKATRRSDRHRKGDCLSSAIPSTTLRQGRRMTTRSRSVGITHTPLAASPTTTEVKNVKVILPPAEYFIKKEEEDKSDADAGEDYLDQDQGDLIGDFFPIVQSTSAIKQEASTSSNDSDQEEDAREERNCKQARRRRAQRSQGQRKEDLKRDSKRGRQKKAIELEAEKEGRQRKAPERKNRRKGGAKSIGNSEEESGGKGGAREGLQEAVLSEEAPPSPATLRRRREAERKRRRRANETKAEREERLRKAREQNERKRARESEAEKEERLRKQRERRQPRRSIFDETEEKREERRRKMREQKRRFNSKLTVEQRREIYRRENERRRLARSQMTAEQKAELENSRFFALEAKKATLSLTEWEEEEFQRKMNGYMRKAAYKAKFTTEEWTERQKEVRGRNYGSFATLPVEKKKMRMEKHKEYLKRIDPEKRKQYHKTAMKNYTNKLKETDPAKWEQVYSNILKANRNRVARETPEERLKRLLRYKIYQAKRKAKLELEKEGLLSPEEIEVRLAEVARRVEEKDRLDREKKPAEFKPRLKARKPKKQGKGEEEVATIKSKELEEPLTVTNPTVEFELALNGSEVVMDPPVETAQIPVLSVNGHSIIFVTCLSLSHPYPPQEPIQIPMGSLQVEGLENAMEIYEAHLVDPLPIQPLTFSQFSLDVGSCVELEADNNYQDYNGMVGIGTDHLPLPPSDGGDIGSGLEKSSPTLQNEGDVAILDDVAGQDDSPPSLISFPSSPINIPTLPDELLQESAAQEPNWSFLELATETDIPIDPCQPSQQVSFVDSNIPDSFTESLRVDEDEQNSPSPATDNIEVIPLQPMPANTASENIVSDSEEKKIVSGEERVICEECGKCMFQQSMKIHKHLFHNPSQVAGAHKCPKCDKEFATAPSLWNHYLNLHEQIKIQTASSSLQDHQEEEEQEVDKDTTTNSSAENGKESEEESSSTRPSFICDQCGKEYRRKGDCEVHIKRVHLEQRILCEICGKEEQSESKLWRHKRARHPELNAPPPRGMVICQYCSEPVLRSLPHHVKKAHPEHYQQFVESGEKKKEMERTKRLNCLKCGRIVRKDSMKRHMRNVHGQGSKAIPCIHCGKEFKEQYHLNEHIRVMHTLSTFDRKVDAMKLIKEKKEEGQQTLLFCSLCDYKLYIRKEMGAHLLSAHLEVFEHLKKGNDEDPPPWKCGECSSPPSFGSEKLFYSHVQSSHPKKKYYCSQLNCHKLFETRTLLRTHHSKEHPQAKFRNPLLHENGYYRHPRLTCASCKALFSRRTDLKEHVQSHHPDSYWPCPHCRLVCFSEQQLEDRHLLRCTKNPEGGARLPKRNSKKKKKNEGRRKSGKGKASSEPPLATRTRSWTRAKTKTGGNKLQRNVRLKSDDALRLNDEKLSQEVKVMLKRLSNEEMDYYRSSEN